jgi:hypothetical protein
MAAGRPKIAVKHIDEAVRLMTAAAQSDDRTEQVLLLLRVASAWLELARHDLKPTDPIARLELPTLN